MISEYTSFDLERARRNIAKTVRKLRLSRGWTQKQLAAQLELSQARLSEIERGSGSFSAEQLLAVMSLFNVAIDKFAASDPRHDALQNALARFGAFHLREVPNVASSRYAVPSRAVEAVLLEPSSSRFVTALAPVLVWSINEIALHAVQHSLNEAGVGSRLGWLAENTLRASQELELSGSALRATRLRVRRAETVIEPFLTQTRPPQSPPIDVFDRGIRRRVTVDRVVEDSSAMSKKWGIISRLQVADFGRALELAFRQPDRGHP